MVASNYKTIDKETKEYCVTVSNLIKQRHGDLIAVDKLRAQEGHPGEKKKKEKLVQREVLSLATVKTNGDKNEHSLMAPIVHYDQHKTPIIITTSSVDPLAWPLNLTTSPSMVASQDPKNGMPRLLSTSIFLMCRGAQLITGFKRWTYSMLTFTV
jgi:hypothetical protein